MHNRVETIDEVAERLRGLCPTLRFTVAHGAAGGGRARDADDGVPARRRRRAGVHVDHRIGHRHPGREHADRRTCGPLRAQPSSTRSADASGVSRERAYAYLLYDAAGALTPQAAQRLAALSDFTELGSGFQRRDARPRAARRGQPARRRAVGARRRARLRALHADARRGARRSTGAGRGCRRARMGARARRHRRRRLRAGGLRRLRAGQDRPHRRVAGAREVAEIEELPRGAGRPLRARRPSRSSTCSRSSAPASSSAPRGCAA